MRPFKSTFAVNVSKKPLLDAWYGAKDLANSSEFRNYSVHRSDYMEKGPEYFKDFKTNNIYLPTPKNVAN